MLFTFAYLGKLTNNDSVCGTGRQQDRNPSSCPTTDVVEAQAGKTVIPHPVDACPWRYGTVGVGIDLARMVWPDQKLIFSSQRKSFPLPGNDAVLCEDLGPPNRVSKKLLDRHPVDCLLIEACSEDVWSPWIIAAHSVNRPKVILYFTSSDHLVTDISPSFRGAVRENTWRTKLAGIPYDSRLGHGRVLMTPAGLPASRIWSMVDDFLVHSPTKRACCAAFSEFMDHMVRLGFICQQVKTSPPAQVQKFCGLLFDTRSVPCLRIPTAKISRSLVTLTHVIKLNIQGNLSRLSASVLAGLLQSLVDATPSRLGQTYLRGLYDDIHLTSDLLGRDLYYTKMTMHPATLADLVWWQTFLQLNPGNPSRSGSTGHLTMDWGDGSGTGTGGTSETLGPQESSSSVKPMTTWMGAWAPHVHRFSSNWRELRTLVWSLERHVRKTEESHLLYGDGSDTQHVDLQGGTVFYFTDNLVTYYVMQNGSSSSPELHKLVRAAKLLELQLQCRVEVVHVPGKLMIIQGTDGLSRGIWIAPERLFRSSLAESLLTLEAVPFSPIFGTWLLHLCGYSSDCSYYHHTGTSAWQWSHIHRQLSIWTPPPELGRQAIGHFLDCWVERAHETAAIFVIPRILQRDWGHMAKHILEVGTFYPTTVPALAPYVSLIPFVVLHIPCHTRSLPRPDRLESSPSSDRYEPWHRRQAEFLRGLQ
jgi:hypothetical protein